jgi:hypothetical protein
VRPRAQSPEANRRKSALGRSAATVFSSEKDVERNTPLLVPMIHFYVINAGVVA